MCRPCGSRPSSPEYQDPVQVGRPVRRRRRHWPDGDRQLLHRRQPGAAHIRLRHHADGPDVLSRRDAVRRADAGEAVRQLPRSLGKSSSAVSSRTRPGRPSTRSTRPPARRSAPSLGRNPAAGANATVTVPIIRPQTMFTGRATQLDLRVSKLITLGAKTRLDAHVDAYNVLNASSIITVVSPYGPLWTQPSGLNAILEGRLIQFGGRLSF